MNKQHLKNKRLKALVKPIFWLLSLSCLHLAILPEISIAQDYGSDIKIVGIHLEGKLDDDPQSGYNQLMKAVWPSSIFSASYRRYPFVRANRNFRVGEKVCLFPASRSSVKLLHPNIQFDLEVSTPVDIVSAHIISAPHTPIINNIKGLSGLTIAVQNSVGIPLLEREVTDINILRTPNDLSSLRMVIAGHADAMYGWFPDIFITAERNKLPLPHFNPDFILYQTTTHLVCKVFAESTSIIDIFDKRLADLKLNGELKRMLGRYANIAD